MKAKGTAILAIAAASLIGLSLTTTPSDAAWRGGWRGGGWRGGWAPGWRGYGWRPGLAIGAAILGAGIAASSWGYYGGYPGYYGYGYGGYGGCCVRCSGVGAWRLVNYC